MKLFKHYLNRGTTALMCLFALSTLSAQQSLQSQKSTESILQEFVESYKNDPMAMSATFGIRVGDQWWHIQVERRESPYAVGKEKQYTFHELGPNQALLNQGPPESPTWYFRFDDRVILEKVYTKTLMAGTAAAKSTSADVVAFDIEDMEGFTSSQGDTALAYLIMEHFWKPDPVEITRFGRDSSLPSHGAAIVSLYTMKDKRISWFTLGQEESANTDRGLDKGQCPNLFIITKGKGKAQIGAEDIDLEPGMSVFVGPYVKHVLYNPNPEPLEGILILYGDNIDYAKGQSYLEFLEQQNTFYTENESKTANAADQKSKKPAAESGEK